MVAVWCLVSEKFTVNSDKSKDEFIQVMSALYDEKKYLTIEVKVGRPRTNQQNRSIRLYWSLMSDAMNNAGFSYKQFIEIVEANGVAVPWDGDKFGDEVWRRVQAAMYPETILKDGKPSTTKLKSDQVARVYDVVNLKIIEMTNGLHVDFPERDK